MNLLAQRLKDMREEKNLSQNQLSKITGIPQRSISRWEQGSSSIMMANIIALAKFFGCTSDYLIGLEN